jgi:hypothetical protein
MPQIAKSWHLCLPLLSRQFSLTLLVLHRRAHARVCASHNSPGELRQIGNEQTFNVEDILAKNLLSSEYLRSLEKRTFEELVDEIFERVKNTDAWLVRKA